jgi:hypothetical protein
MMLRQLHFCSLLLCGLAVAAIPAKLLAQTRLSNPKIEEGYISVSLKFGTQYPAEFMNNDQLEAIGAGAQALTYLRKLQAERYDETHPKDYCEQEWQVTRFQLVGNPAHVEKIRRPLVRHTTPTRAQKIFTFHTDEFWLNLHHFLYVLGRAENKVRDASRNAVVNAPKDQEQGLAKLAPAEQGVWRAAVSFYANALSKKDVVFDEPLPGITKRLAQARNEESLAATDIDQELVSVLERAAPLYRRAWWSAHNSANLESQRSIQRLVDQYGTAILDFITRAYQMRWSPHGFDVHLSGYANWAGAYSTTGQLLVVSSLADDIKGAYGLETIFHEGMHQWDDQVFEALRQQARKENKLTPNGLSHAMIFFTAGDAVHRVLPNHVPYAEKFGVWQRGSAQFKTPLEEIWKPYLDGHGTRDQALDELIKRTGINRSKN